MGGLYRRGFQDGFAQSGPCQTQFSPGRPSGPAKIRDAFRSWVRAQLPPDCKVDFQGHGASPASQMSTDNPAFEKARAALSDEWPNPAAYVGCGGSIPIAGYFKNILGMDAMLIGFGKDDDQIHSPNEKYDLSSFHKGTRSWARILAALA